jgi:hypothetical protein
MARRIQNRMEKRAEYEAYERRQAADEGEDDDEDEEDDEEAEGGAEAGEEADKDEGEEEEAPPAKPVKAPRPKTRSRAAKVARLRLVWGVFTNANVRVATYEYPRRHEAEEHAARLTADKKSVHFVQPVKEPIEEKKEG